MLTVQVMRNRSNSGLRILSNVYLQTETLNSIILNIQESDIDLTSISASLDLGLMMHRKCVGCLCIFHKLKFY